MTETTNWEPKIIAFLCNWCSYAGADLAGVSRFQYPPNIRIVRVQSPGREAASVSGARRHPCPGGAHAALSLCSATEMASRSRRMSSVSCSAVRQTRNMACPRGTVG